MKISYAITVCNEFLEIQKLVPFLLENKRIQDEIVILYDQKNGDPEVLNYLTYKHGGDLNLKDILLIGKIYLQLIVLEIIFSK